MVRCHVGRRGRIGAEAIAGITAGLSFARPSGRAFFGGSAGGRGGLAMGRPAFGLAPAGAARVERAVERRALLRRPAVGGVRLPAARTDWARTGGAGARRQAGAGIGLHGCARRAACGGGSVVGIDLRWSRMEAKSRHLLAFADRLSAQACTCVGKRSAGPQDGHCCPGLMCTASPRKGGPLNR